MAWKLDQTSTSKENVSDGRNGTPRTGSGSAGGQVPPGTRTA